MSNEFLNEVNQVLNENEQQQQREQQQVFPIDNEIVRLFWNFIFEKIATHYNDERLKLTEAESDLLTNATTKWLSYRLPSLMLKYSVDFDFILAVLSVLTSKLVIIKNAKPNNSYFGTQGTRENYIDKENHQ